VADDDRTRRRLGDETKSRIAGLASGWSVDSAPPEPAAAPEDASPPRKKQRTIPPPAPGSPERKAFEQQIIATSQDRADRDDTTDVLPPKRPTGAQPIIAATTAARDDATEELIDTDPAASPLVRERVKGTTGPQPVVGARTKGSTGQQPIISGEQPVVGARAKGATGPQSVIGLRAKTGTGQQSIIPDIPMRPKRSTAQQGAGPRTRGGTGQHSLIPTRSQTSTGQQRILDERERDRVLSATGPHSILGAVVAAPADTSDTKPHSGVPPRRPPGSSVPPPLPLVTPRTKPASVPPPPPGSPVRVAAERGDAFSTQPFGSANRSKPASTPPPPPDRSSPLSTQPLGSTGTRPPAAPAPIAPGRSKPVSVAPPIAFPTSDSWSTTAPAEPSTPLEPAPASGPRFPRASNDASSTPFSAAFANAFATESRTFSTEPRTPAVIIDASLGAEPAAAAPKQVVPTGEFDSGVRTIEDSTSARGRTDALEETPVEDLLEDDETGDDDDDGGAEVGQRPLHAAPDPATERFERGDPTQNAPPDGTHIAHVRGKHPTGGTLRNSAALRRKRGLWGDVRYVSTAVFGVRRSRREVAELEHRQGLRLTSRRRHLITLGRTAAVMDNFDHPSLGKSREQLGAIEDERSKHAGAVAASDAELERVRRDRDNSAKQFLIAMSEADAEIAELAKKLEPIEKEALAARKRASDLRDELHRIEKQIAEAEASLVSARSEKVDKAAVQADIATYKANKVAVLRDEPVIAAELDGLNPRIAAMDATRAGLEKKKAELEKAEQEDQRRTLELLEAIGAKRKVVERAAADAETARDNALFDLGERLYVDRPSILTAQLSPIDQIDLELGEGERRSMELREILSNIDKAKLARGLAMIILAVGVLASLAYLIASAAL
jgi:hypothetical protein